MKPLLTALRGWAAVVASALAAATSAAPAHGADAFLLPPTPVDEVGVSVLFLPDDLPRLAAPPAEGQSRLVVTGAYTSGERFAPEGFVLREGAPTHPWPQGWDGLLLVDDAGRAGLHDVSRVAWGGKRYDLRDRGARTQFLEIAKHERLTALQSHLLINAGALDVREVEDAPRFRRRLLFETADGRLGVFDTSPEAVTLYDAAARLLALEPEVAMAINLDMGAYDFCERADAAGAERCGLLGRQTIEKLTNLVAFVRRAPE